LFVREVSNHLIRFAFRNAPLDLRLLGFDQDAQRSGQIFPKTYVPTDGSGRDKYIILAGEAGCRKAGGQGRDALRPRAFVFGSASVVPEYRHANNTCLR